MTVSANLLQAIKDNWKFLYKKYFLSGHRCLILWTYRNVFGLEYTRKMALGRLKYYKKKTNLKLCVVHVYMKKCTLKLFVLH